MKTLLLINEAIKFFITGFIIIIIHEIKEVEGLGTYNIIAALDYRQQTLKTTNPGTPKPGNCFELPSDWLLSY